MKHLLILAALLSSCSIFNLGGTNEDGSPKTGEQARVVFRSIGDAAIRTWGTDAIKQYVPEAMGMFDLNQDSVLSLDELEAAVDLEDPDRLVVTLVIAIQLLRNKP